MINTVELNERVRSMNPARRLGYSLTVAVGIVLAFWFSIVGGVILAAVLVVVLIGGPLAIPDDIIALSLPIFIIFMLTIGISGMGGQNRILTGQDIGQFTRRSARSGLIVGLISGAIFGLGWALLISANPLLFAVVLGIALALPLAFFRAVACLIEPVSLRLVGGKSV
jgi:hypothetical protein